MTIDCVLNRVSLWLTGMADLDYYGASSLVNQWLAPLGWLHEQILRMLDLPVLGVLAAAVAVPLGVFTAFLAVALVYVTLLVAHLLAAIAGVAVWSLIGPFAHGWMIARAFGVA